MGIFSGLLASPFLSTACFAGPQETAKVEVTVQIKEKGQQEKEKQKDEKASEEDRPLIQIALLLDTSNSMDGLISQAKNQLWGIVNDLASTKKDGKLPKIQVALYEYGNSGIPVTKSYVRQVVPMTDDLDKLSEALFALKTNGGDEYCGTVIDIATKNLDWTPGHDHYKTIFIAGNEPFTQGETDYTVSCAAARGSGIVVNTIHCGDKSTGVRGKWQHGAEVGGGKFMNINSDKRAVIIKCPQDAKLQELNIKLNATYLYFGSDGKKRFLGQAKLDRQQLGAGGAGGLSSRIISKGNANVYSNGNWDLLDASNNKSFDITKIDKKTLPEKYRKMSDKELKDAIEEMKKKRSAIQKEISKVAKERLKYIAEEMKKRPDDQKDTFGRALQEAARSQAEKKGFKK